MTIANIGYIIAGVAAIFIFMTCMKILFKQFNKFLEDHD